MPIDSVAKPVTYLCDGNQTAFPITFTYLDNSFVWVRRTNGVTLGVEPLSLGDDYTIAADTVDTIATYPTGDKLTLSLLIPMKQLVDLEKNGRIDADVLDYVHDKLTLICQELDMDVETLVGLEVPEDPAPSMKVPDADTRANKYLAFDAQGNIVVVSALDTGVISVSPWGETFIGLANSAAGRAQLDVYSEAEADAAIDADVAVLGADLGGAGRTTETIKDNQDDIVDLAGSGRTTETVKQNADDIDYSNNTANTMGELTQVGDALILDATITYGEASLCRLSDTEVAYYSRDAQEIVVLSFNGTTWSQTGNAYAVAGAGGALAKLTATTIAFCANVIDELRTLSWDGTDFSLVGNALSITDLGTPFMTALSPTSVMISTNTATDFARAYSWDGTDWTAQGNKYTSLTSPRAKPLAISETEILLVDGASLKSLYYDGTDWSATSVSPLTITSSGNVTAIDMLSREIGIFLVDATGIVEYFRYNGAVLSEMATKDYDTFATTDTNYPEICAMTDSTFALVQYASGGARTIRMMQINTPSISPNLPWSTIGW